MTVSFVPVARVRNGRTDTRDAGWGGLESTLEFAPEFAGGLDGLEHWSHALVVFHLHVEPADARPAPGWRRRPRDRADLPLLGVFAQRGRLRPNPIGVTAVRIVRVEPPRLVVRDLDAIDGTPVLDVKPWTAAFDAVEGARAPAWFEALMRDYF